MRGSMAMVVRLPCWTTDEVNTPHGPLSDHIWLHDVGVMRAPAPWATLGAKGAGDERKCDAAVGGGRLRRVGRGAGRAHARGLPRAGGPDPSGGLARCGPD